MSGVPTDAQRKAALERNLPVSRPSTFSQGYQAALADVLAALEWTGAEGAQEWIDNNRQGW